MDKERYAERILETENLTDELEDSDANWLLDWGITSLERVLQGVENEDAAGSRVNALMAVMRKINRIVGSYADKSPQRLAEDLAELYSLYSTAFGQPGGPPAHTDVTGSGAADEPPSTKPTQTSEENNPPQPCYEPPSLESSQLFLPPPSGSAQPPNAASSHEPSTPPIPASPDFTATADHLSQLSPTDALHFLAQDFFPLP